MEIDNASFGSTRPSDLEGQGRSSNQLESDLIKVGQPFSDRPKQKYEEILRQVYARAIHEELSAFRGEVDTALTSQKLVEGKFKGSLRQLINSSEEEEIQNADRRIQKLLAEYHDIQNNRDILHLFISAPILHGPFSDEQAMRKEQVEVYAEKNVLINSLPGERQSNAVVVEVERKLSVGSIISTFIEKASKMPDIKRLSIIMLGHGEKDGNNEGCLLLGGTEDERESLLNDEIIRSLNIALRPEEHVQKPDVSLILTQCYSYLFDHKAASEMPFDVVWFTTADKQLTTNQPAVGIRNRWHHKELDEYAQLQQATVFSTREHKQQLEAESKLKEKDEIIASQAEKIARLEAKVQLIDNPRGNIGDSSQVASTQGQNTALENGGFLQEIVVHKSSLNEVQLPQGALSEYPTDSLEVHHLQNRRDDQTGGALSNDRTSRIIRFCSQVSDFLSNPETLRHRWQRARKLKTFGALFFLFLLWLYCSTWVPPPCNQKCYNIMNGTDRGNVFRLFMFNIFERTIAVRYAACYKQYAALEGLMGRLPLTMTESSKTAFSPNVFLANLVT